MVERTLQIMVRAFKQNGDMHTKDGTTKKKCPKLRWNQYDLVKDGYLVNF